MAAHGRSNPGTGSPPARYPGTFLLAFREAVAGLHWQVRRWLGDAVVCADADGEEHTVGLENLYRRARRVGRAAWPEYIADFLGKVRLAEASAVAGADLPAVADRLLVRLGRPFAKLPGGVRVWSQPLAGTGLVVSLVLDQDQTMTYVTEAMVEASGRPGADWVPRALANLRARTPAEWLQVVHEESGLATANVRDAYDASRALLVPELFPGGLPSGCLLAVPSRDDLLVLPVSRSALAAAHMLRLLTDKTFKNAPYPISDDIFWVDGAAWHVFGVDVRHNEVTLRPPDAFVPVLERLCPEGAPPREGPAPEA